MPYCPNAKTECVWYGKCPPDCLYLNLQPAINPLELLAEIMSSPPEPSPTDSSTLSIPFTATNHNEPWGTWCLQAKRIPEGLGQLLITTLSSIFPRANYQQNPDFAEACFGCDTCPHYPEFAPYYGGAGFQASQGSLGALTIRFSCNARSTQTPCFTSPPFCIDIPTPTNPSLIPPPETSHSTPDETFLNKLGDALLHTFLPDFGQEY